MPAPKQHGQTGERSNPLDMTAQEFRAAGHRLVDRLAELLESFRERPVTRGESRQAVRRLLGTGSLPAKGENPQRLLDEAAELLIGHSLFNGHPRFWGYITASPAPIGILGELLAAAVNPNVGAWVLAPVASEIEAQTVRWIAEAIGYPGDCGGLLVSGGNMANFVGFLAARKAQAPWDLRAGGFASPGARRLRVYVSTETHTWIQKATDLFGLGTEAIRWLPTDAGGRMDVEALRKQILADRAAGDLPFLLVGTAGTVSTGAIDLLPELAALAREHGLWFHVDGAYGGLAAVVPDGPPDLAGIAQADSVAVDPHKWLYAPLEAGCALVRNSRALLEAFSYRPPYYHFESSEEEVVNYFEYGLQNSRGFRALKVWLALRQAGREGLAQLIAGDIRLAQELYRRLNEHPALQTFTHDLSIVTFRYVPPDLKARAGQSADYLNRLNTEILNRLQAGGEAFVSNALRGDAFVLRACLVNFRTTLEDVSALPGIVARLGEQADRELRPTAGV
jgi:aromatic-L-amino-acid/L-tryptophan decarboxylase